MRLVVLVTGILLWGAWFGVGCATPGAGQSAESGHRAAVRVSNVGYQRGAMLRALQSGARSYQRSDMPSPHAFEKPPSVFSGDSIEASRSVGTVTRGYLVGAERLRQPKPHLVAIEKQRHRGLNYATSRLIRLLEAGADHLAHHTARDALYFGNLSARRGGNIPYSVSHNSGRDADVAFFLKRANGEPYVPRKYVRLDGEGKATVNGQTLRFDTEANWYFVQGLLESDAATVQFIFVSKPLRRRLLEYATEHGARPGVVERAEEVLHQPSNAPPHSDHFHIRMYCSKVSIRAGCRDFGPGRPDPSLVESTRERMRRLLEANADSSDPGVRLEVARRVSRMRYENMQGQLHSMLEDPDPRVRAAGIRSLRQLERGAELVERSPTQDAASRVRAEFIYNLGYIDTDPARKRLVDLLQQPWSLKLSKGLTVDSQDLVADAMIRQQNAYFAEPLVDRLSSATESGYGAVVRALRYTTNHRVSARPTSSIGPDPDMTDKWEQWFEAHRGSGRQAWLVDGFRKAGFEVESLDVSSAWALCRAVEGSDYLSYNAQRVLMRVTGHRPNSLDWPKDAAGYYWTRWFRKRRSKYELPPFPGGDGQFSDAGSESSSETSKDSTSHEG